MNSDEFKALWASLNETQRKSVRAKAQWEYMSLFKVCNNYPGIWNDEQRLKALREPINDGTCPGCGGTLEQCQCCGNCGQPSCNCDNERNET